MREYRKHIFLTIGIVILFWSLTFILPMFFTAPERGTFGDMFGAVNALFSGLAFAGIILTIYMQHEELKLQRQELKDTRGVFETQVQLMIDQQNDNTFFNLLSNHRQHVESFREGRMKIIGSPLNPKGTLKEAVSGYEVISEISDNWSSYLFNYSNSFKRKIILDLGKGTADPLKMITSNLDVMTLYDETCHIYRFVNARFPSSEKNEFYSNTFLKNLSFAEKVLFEIIYENFPDRNNDIDHKTIFYQNFECIDFHQCKLPKIRLQVDTRLSSPHYIGITHDCKLVDSVLIIYNANNNILELVDKIYFKPIKDSEYLRISFEDLICESNLGISSFPVEDHTKLQLHKFALNYRFRKDHIEFDFLFGIHPQINHHHQFEEKKFYDIYLDDPKMLSENDAIKILTLVRD